MQGKTPSALESILVFAITILVMALLLEGFLVFQNKNGKNYDIEMWKYSRSLKRVSDNPHLGHEHIPSKSAKLQNIDIRINALGMRGAEPIAKPDLKIMVLGSSITLGWGVQEEEIYPELIRSRLNKLGKQIEVYNAGIGNYNTTREVEAFLSKHKNLNPNIIVLSYFVNDAEILPSPKRNWLLENSQLAVTLWSRLEQIKRKFGVEESFEDHYKNIYTDNYPGWIETQKAFARLSDYAKANNAVVVVTMIPDIHNLKNYPFTFIHRKIEALSAKNGFWYVDFYNSFRHVEKQEDLWAMPGDPHPNAQGHLLMADQLYPVLEDLVQQNPKSDTH